MGRSSAAWAVAPRRLAALFVAGAVLDDAGLRDALPAGASYLPITRLHHLG